MYNMRCRVRLQLRGHRMEDVGGSNGRFRWWRGDLTPDWEVGLYFESFLPTFISFSNMFVSRGKILQFGFLMEGHVCPLCAPLQQLLLLSFPHIFHIFSHFPHFFPFIPFFPSSHFSDGRTCLSPVLLSSSCSCSRFLPQPFQSLTNPWNYPGSKILNPFWWSVCSIPPPALISSVSAAGVVGQLGHSGLFWEPAGRCGRGARGFSRAGRLKVWGSDAARQHFTCPTQRPFKTTPPPHPPPP